MSRLTWQLNRNGARFPSWSESAAGEGGGGGRRFGGGGDDDDPSGSGGQVLPGRYKVVLSFNGERDSTFVNVKFDPRVTVSMKDLADKQAAQKDFQGLIQKATDAFNRLKEATKTIKLADDALVNAPDSTKKSIAKLGNSLKDSILNIQKIFMASPDLKGINRQPNALMDELFRAMMMANSSDGKPSTNGEAAIAAAKTHAREIFEKVNMFFEKDWAKYQAKVEAARSTLFKKYEPIKID